MTNRVPYTVPPEIIFPHPLTNHADPRLKHRFQPWEGPEADVVLIGVPFDEGVALGGGRPGAAGGPAALRKAMLRYGTTYDAEQDIDFDHLRLADAGDLEVIADNVAATHERLAEAVTAMLNAGAVPVVVGGGHDATFGSVKALMDKYSQVAGINVDAHLDEALAWADEARGRGEALSIGLAGNAAEVYPALVQRGVIPDMVSDQTPAHDLGAYVPVGDLAELDELRVSDPAEYHRRSLASIARHAEAILEMQRQGAIAFDYGNNLRAQAERAGVEVRQSDGAYKYPGFVPAYIRPLFCRGMGLFRWAAISGDPKDIHTIDRELLQLFPDNEGLARWIRLASEKVPFLGLPTRICWLGCGDRARFGQAINSLVANGRVSAPIVIGRDHLDTGSVASPDRETEGLLDGSDAVADWPLLNFALNTAAGASWVSFHHGGSVGIGNALHAGMVIVADGTAERAERLERVLTVDPGIGVARHALSGYQEAQQTAAEKGIHLP